MKNLPKIMGLLLNTNKTYSCFYLRQENKPDQLDLINLWIQVERIEMGTYLDHKNPSYHTHFALHLQIWKWIQPGGKTRFPEGGYRPNIRPPDGFSVTSLMQKRPKTSSSPDILRLFSNLTKFPPYDVSKRKPLTNCILIDWNNPEFESTLNKVVLS